MSRLYTDNIAQFIAYFENVCDVKLHWYQLMMLRIMWRYECAVDAVNRLEEKVNEMA